MLFQQTSNRGRWCWSGWWTSCTSGSSSASTSCSLSHLAHSKQSCTMIAVKSEYQEGNITWQTEILFYSIQQTLDLCYVIASRSFNQWCLFASLSLITLGVSIQFGWNLAEIHQKSRTQYGIKLQKMVKRKWNENEKNLRYTLYKII